MEAKKWVFTPKIAIFPPLQPYHHSDTLRRHQIRVDQGRFGWGGWIGPRRTQNADQGEGRFGQKFATSPKIIEIFIFALALVHGLGSTLRSLYIRNQGESEIPSEVPISLQLLKVVLGVSFYYRCRPPSMESDSELFCKTV